MRLLEAEWHRCRFLWNEAVHLQRIGRRPTFCRLSKLLTEARNRSRWLQDGSRVVQQQTLRTYAQALTNSYQVKGTQRPVVKRRKTTLPSLEYGARGFSIQDGVLHLAKGLTVPVVWSRALPSDPRSVRVYRDSLGHWYASFVVRRGVEPAPELDGRIGIDWGVTTTATTTDPAYDLPYGGHRKRCAAALAKVQRKMSRRRRPRGQAPSKGYQHAKRLTAMMYKKASRQNAHASRVWVQRVVAYHQTIAVEDFRSRFLGRSTMARKAADAAIGSAKRELLERGKRAGRKVVLVPPAYTTMTCSECFARAKQPLGLAERVFRCEHCGYTADRDRNAARTILAVAERNHASVDDVRRAVPLSMEGSGVLSELGISRNL